mmetsp:Transcript_3499/g.6582  ORF Transcript_3499/g.6582 Transcript_3499/m.6582 type:complete len:237 (-) Transcript_3499:73-783(-)
MYCPLMRNKSPYVRISMVWPTAAAACFSDRDVGRFFQPRYLHPTPTAPEVTSITPYPARTSPRSVSTNNANVDVENSRSTPFPDVNPCSGTTSEESRMIVDVPIFTTTIGRLHLSARFTPPISPSIPTPTRKSTNGPSRSISSVLHFQPKFFPHSDFLCQITREITQTNQPSKTKGMRNSPLDHNQPHPNKNLARHKRHQKFQPKSHNKPENSRSQRLGNLSGCLPSLLLYGCPSR